jgi:hypothetical protein
MNGSRNWCSLTQWNLNLAIRNNDKMWFEGKWMQLEDIMISEVRQSQNKVHIFSLIHGRWIQKLNRLKRNMITYKLLCRLFYGTQGRREKKKD